MSPTPGNGVLVQGDAAIDDLTKLVTATRVLAEQGNARAQHNLGALYMEGQGVAQDFAQAAQWFLKAARQGEVLSQHNLGSLLIQGLGVQVNPEEALSWFTLAAEQGNSRSQFNLGALYLEGLGVEQDLVLAYMWLHIAALGAPGVSLQEAETVRDYVAGLLSPPDLRQALEMVEEWLENHPRPEHSPD